MWASATVDTSNAEAPPIPGLNPAERRYTLDQLVDLRIGHAPRQGSNPPLDAVVREVDLAIEVRQVVFARPLANLVLVSVGAAIAVGASAVVFLEELLVLALQVLFDNDTPNLEPVVLVSKPGFLLAVRRIEIGVVVDLALAANLTPA